MGRTVALVTDLIQNNCTRRGKMNPIKKGMEFLKALADKGEKKLLEYAIMVVIIGIIIMIAAGTFFESNAGSTGDENKKNLSGEDMEVASRNVSENKFDDIANDIAKVLSEIEGAGKVTVMITYNSGEEIVPAQDVRRIRNITQERDSGGGTRDIDQYEYESSIVFEDNGGENSPIVLKTKMPEVKGVIVVAEGAGNAVVKENLVRAVQVLTDVPIHKIQVFKRGKG